MGGTRRGRARSAYTALLVTATLVALVTATPTPARGSGYTESFVTMVGHRGDWISQGVSRYFHPGNGTVGAGWNRSTLFVQVHGGPYGETFNFEFAVPEGQRLKVGDYERAQRAPFQEPGRPGIAISGEGRGCNEVSGRFTIKDIQLEDRGRVSRLWLTYQHNCEGSGPPLIGEVRYRVPGDGGDLLIGPRSVRWPNLPAGGVAAVVPVRAVNTASSSVRVSSVALDAPADMTVRLDECSGRTLLSNESCAVWVRFAPSSQGLQSGTLSIVEQSGIAHSIPLEGNVSGTAESSPVAAITGGTTGGGSTEFSYVSDEGDYIGQGETRSYDLSNADFHVTGSHHGVSAEIFTDAGDNWHASFYPSTGDILAPGFRFPSAGRAAFSGGTAGLDVSGAGRGCNTLEGEFTVHALRVNDFGELLEFHASFEQHCEGMEPALRGTFSYQHPNPSEPPDPFPPPQPDPEPKSLERDVSLVIRDRYAKGFVRMSDPVTRCLAEVPVKVQRKRDGRFRTVGKTLTTGAGGYQWRVGRKLGSYRAIAVKKELGNGNVCERAVSRTWRY